MRKPRLFFILYLIMVLLIARAMIFVLYLFIHTESMAPHRGSSWHRLNKSLIHDAISIDPTSASTLTKEAFPAATDPTIQWPSLDLVYPRYNPHRGEIPPDVMALLNAPPALTHPRARFNGTSRTAWTHHAWSHALNGSRTQPDDAMHPSRQPKEHDGRPYPYNNWTSPLADMDTLYPQRQERVQFGFEDASQYSGKRFDPKRDQLLKKRQKLVKSAFIRAWQGYKDYAWGADEVTPVTEKYNNHFNGWGATIIDSLDTLLIMGLDEEYRLAREHVHDVDFYFVGGSRSAYSSADGRIPVFETAIRYLGGLLSAYDLTGDSLMVERAEELAQLILPAFNTLTGVPLGRMRPGENVTYATDLALAYSGEVVLAEATSMLLEYTRLWQVTGNRTYFDRVQRVTDFLDRNMTKLSQFGTLLPAVLYPEEGIVSSKYSFGGGLDSYYEYLVKEHQLLGGVLPQYERMFTEAMDSAEQHLWKNVTVVPHAPSLSVVVSSTGQGRSHVSLEHLACFSGGMMALGSRIVPDRRHYLNIARMTTETCYWGYNSSLTGLGAEALEFYHPQDKDLYRVVTDADGTRHRGSPVGDPFVGVRFIWHEDYRNRPEVIESVLYMWRTTGDPVWQERGWQMFASWMTHCLTRSGASTIYDVNAVPVRHSDSMESFVLAETFKYYYLLFSPPDLVSLDDFVFSTEAHPFLLPRAGRWARAGDVPASFPPVDRRFPAIHRPRGQGTPMQRGLWEAQRQTKGKAARLLEAMLAEVNDTGVVVQVV